MKEMPTQARACFSLYVVAICNVLFVITVLLGGDPERRSVVGYLTALPINVGLIALLIWMARSVRCGRRFAGTAGLLVFLVFGSLMALGIMLVSGLRGSMMIPVMLGIYATAQVVALVRVLRASVVATGGTRARETPERDEWSSSST